MVLYELMEGNVPFYRERTNMRVPLQLNSLVICGRRPALTTKPNLARLERLMHHCWRQSPDNRQTAERIVAEMKKPEFRLQNRLITSLYRSADFIKYFCHTEVYSSDERVSLVMSSHDWESTTAFNDSDGAAFNPDSFTKANTLQRLVSPLMTPERKDSDTSSEVSSSTASSAPSTADSIKYELLFVASGDSMHRKFCLIDMYTDAVVSGPEDMPGPPVRCAVTVRSTLWVGTSAHGNGGSRVEVYDIQAPCRLHETQRFSKDSSVLCMASLEFPVASDDAGLDPATEALQDIDVSCSMGILQSACINCQI